MLTLGTTVSFFEKAHQDFLQNTLLDFTSSEFPLLLEH